MFNKKDINDYMNKITPKQEEELIDHCETFETNPDICAWYDDMNDFYSDWVYENNIYDTEQQADERFKETVNTGEFKMFSNGEIVRLVK